MFAQIIRGKVSDPSAVRPLVDRWNAEIAPKAAGWLGSTGGISDDDELFVLVRFDSEEAARANSDRPEQGRWWGEMEQLLDGPVTFQDSNDVRVETYGDPDSAGFVQVMTGQTSDPVRARELMDQDRPDMSGFRPEILGSVVVGHQDGKWTMVIYFTSEAAAREGERKEPPPELQEQMRKTMEEVAALAVGEPQFLDLRRPFLDAPH